jgi:hypothetical protein
MDLLRKCLSVFISTVLFPNQLQPATWQRAERPPCLWEQGTLQVEMTWRMHRLLGSCSTTFRGRFRQRNVPLGFASSATPVMAADLSWGLMNSVRKLLAKMTADKLWLMAAITVSLLGCLLGILYVLVLR